MNEFTESYEALKGSLLRTLVYTIGHVLISVMVVKTVTDASITEALMDSTIEPAINAVWFFVLDRLWTAKGK